MGNRTGGPSVTSQMEVPGALPGASITVRGWEATEVENTSLSPRTNQCVREGIVGPVKWTAGVVSMGTGRPLSQYPLVGKLGPP